MTFATDAVFLIVTAGTAATILVAVATRRPVQRAAWLAIGLAMVLYTIANLLTVASQLGGDPSLGLAGQGLYVLGYPLFFVAALRFALGSRRIDPVVLIDAAIIAIATVLLVWELVVEPLVPVELTGDGLVLAIGYPVVATLLVTLLLPIVLMRRSRSASAWLLLAGFALIGLTDTRFSLLTVTLGGRAGDVLADLGWLAGYALLAGAAAAPSMARLGAVSPERTVQRDAARFVALSFALMVPPLLIFKEANGGQFAEVRVFAIAAVVLAGLVVWRMQRTVGQFVASDQRFRRFMSVEGFFAGIKDSSGRYLYLNPAALRGSGGPNADWFMRTDLELVEPEIADRRRRSDDWVRRTGETRVSTISDEGRTWVVSRFPMPDNHGAVGFLGIDITSQARAEERLRVVELEADRQTRERALIAETLTALDAGLTPEDTAAAVCTHVAELPEMALASLITFGVDGIATVIGQAVAGGIARPGWRLPPARSEYLRQRATAGPWVERWVKPPRHPYAKLLDSLGVRAHAFAPITRGGEVAGVLIVGSAATDALDRLTERLPALLEFARIASALIGPQLADRIVAERTEAAVRSVIATEAFDIAFQPIVELDGGDIPGYEALARFRDGSDPETHFRRAREAHLSLELELACLRKALQEGGQLEPGAWLNVNVSPELILSDALLPLLPLEDRVVVLEITEHEAITDYEAFRSAIRRLDGRVKVCVDDAGAGYASLRHIVELGPLFVKLDRSLVAGIGSDPARQAVVAGMVRFAESAGLTLIAEGIETPEELRALRLASVPLGQGYLLGRPTVIPALDASVGIESALEVA